MALQLAQVQLVLSAAAQLEQQVQALTAFAQNVAILMQNNLSYTVPGSTDLIALTAQQQADMLAGYATLKNNLQTIFQTLP